MAAPKTSTLTAERARELLRYDPETGKLYWRVYRNSAARAGDEARHTYFDGYNHYGRVGIARSSHQAHRVIWLIVTGEWPKGQIDHIDGNGLNNRWSNLRDATPKENSRNQKIKKNNTSGVNGVDWYKLERKWRAQIRVNGERKFLGCFKKLEDAIAARKAADLEYGFHENHGRKAA